MNSLVLIIRLWYIVNLVVCLIWQLHFITEMLTAFDGNSAYLEVFEVSTIIMLWGKARALVNLS